VKQTKESLQRQLDASNRLIQEMRVELGILKEQNDFLKHYTASGILNTMTITVQRVTATCTNMLQALPSIERLRR
jgi:hypothetical protein